MPAWHRGIFEPEVVLESIRPKFWRQSRTDEEGLDTIFNSEVMTLNSVLSGFICPCGIDLVPIELEKFAHLQISIKLPALVHVYILSVAAGRAISEEIFQPLERRRFG